MKTKTRPFNKPARNPKPPKPQTPINAALATRVEEMKQAMAQANNARQFLAEQELAIARLEGAIKQLVDVGATHPEIPPAPPAAPAAPAEKAGASS